MKKTACKKAAQKAGMLLDKKIEEAYSGIETTNKNIEESQTLINTSDVIHSEKYGASGVSTRTSL